MQDLEPWIEGPQPDFGRIGPRVRWGGGYAVIALRESGQEYDLPGRERLIRQIDVTAQRDVLMLGERSGGGRDFLEWWRSTLEVQGIPWLFVHAGEWAPELIRKSEVIPIPDVAQSSDPIVALGRDISASEKAKILLHWGGALKTVMSLIIRVTGDEIAESTAQAFRMIREENRCPNLQLIIGTEMESSFTDNAFWSGYLGLANCYRLRSFGAAESRKLLEWYTKDLQNGLTLTNEAIEELLNCTGGQPRLVQSLLQRVVESPSGMKVGEAEVRKLFQQMKHSPPDTVRFWQADLIKILLARPELISAMRSYVTGFTLGPARFPPPAQERPLMVSGWIKLNRFGRWGIASQLHASLARPVLDELSRR